MTTVLTALSYVLWFCFGVLCTLGVLTSLDWPRQARHELHARGGTHTASGPRLCLPTLWTIA